MHKSPSERLSQWETCRLAETMGGGGTLLKMHYLILLLCPVINARISSSLTCDEFKNINSEWETGSRKFEGAVGNYNNYNKIRESAADMT